MEGDTMPPDNFSRNQQTLQDLRVSKQQARIIQRQLSRPRPCLLCGTPRARYPVTFLPDTPELWGGQRGKVRVLIYRLCGACYALPDFTQHVEARLQASMGARRN
jgi:hypothetical protein